MDIEENMDDSADAKEISDNMFRSMIQVLPSAGFDCGKGGAEDGEGGYEYSWQGVVGFVSALLGRRQLIRQTVDKVPFVGQIPGKEGMFMIAGMGGHGMVSDREV